MGLCWRINYFTSFAGNWEERRRIRVRGVPGNGRLFSFLKISPQSHSHVTWHDNQERNAGLCPDVHTCRKSIILTVIVKSLLCSWWLIELHGKVTTRACGCGTRDEVKTTDLVPDWCEWQSLWIFETDSLGDCSDEDKPYSPRSF